MCDQDCRQAVANLWSETDPDEWIGGVCTLQSPSARHNCDRIWRRKMMLSLLRKHNIVKGYARAITMGVRDWYRRNPQRSRARRPPCDLPSPSPRRTLALH